jgi:glucan-binding YG repeat protein
MVKGWNWDGTNSWYFDKITGTMVKGTATIDGVTYTFASDTGILVQ